MFIKKKFPLFWANLCGFSFKVCKKCFFKVLIGPKKKKFDKKLCLKKRRILCWFQNYGKGYKKIHALKVIDHFFPYSSNWFPYNFSCVHFFCIFFNRSKISIKFGVFWYLIWIFHIKIYLIGTLSQFLQTLTLNPRRMA